MIKTYNKLVRDHIPEIIRQAGKKCTTEVLSNEDYLRMIDAKLDEELAEYHESGSIEELERVRVRKAHERGSFNRRILLKEVVEN